MPTCDELTAWALSIADPVRYVDTDGTDGRNGWQRSWIDYTGSAPTLKNVDYRVHLGPPVLPFRRPVSRGAYSSLAQVQTALRLLQTYYEAPDQLRLCPAAQGWYHAYGRVRALEALAGWAKSPGFTGGNAVAIGAAVYVLVRVLNDPMISKAGSAETEVGAAAANVVTESKTASFDAATWIPLWALAVGGAGGAASVRTRIYAMKAIQAILRRGTLLPGQILAASSMAEVLRQLVVTRAPNIAATERTFFLSEAEATVGAAAIALDAASTGAMPPPVPLSSNWVVPAVAAAAGLVLVGGAVVIVTARRRTAV